jgi:hypothetical protein
MSVSIVIYGIALSFSIGLTHLVVSVKSTHLYNCRYGRYSLVTHSHHGFSVEFRQRYRPLYTWILPAALDNYQLPFTPGESCLRYRPLYTLILAAALGNPLQFSRQLTITNFLLNLAKVAYATVLYLTLPDHISELDLLYKLNIF